MSVVSRIATTFARLPRTSAAVFSTRKYSADRHHQGDYLKSSYNDIEIPHVSLAEYIFENFRKYSTKTALQCGFTGKKYTYDEVICRSTNLNKALRKRLHLRKGDVAAILLPNVPEFPISILGGLLAGLKITTINPAYTSGEIQRQLSDCNAKVIITLTDFYKNAKDAVTKTNKDINIITIKSKSSECTPQGAINFDEFINEKHDIADIELPSPDEIVFMPYSSGTTGLPKGVQLSSSNIVANIAQFNHPDLKISETATDEHQDVTSQILPIFHIYGFSTTLSMLREGVKIVTLPQFDRDIYIDILVKEKLNFMLVVPPIVIFLYTCPDIKSAYFDSLRTVNCGAAPLGALDEDKFRNKIGRPINVLQGYGLSETSPVVTMVPIRSQGKCPGSMGTGVPNTMLKVVAPDDPEGKHLGPNQVGELLIKGPQVMKSYHNREEETRQAFQDGWFKTGDLVRYDDNGMFYIADRLKELIKVKGLQVPPAELEEIIRDYPGVADAAVIGIPDTYCGEVPRAYVVPKKNEVINAEKLRAFVAERVARHKHLKGGIALVDSIPKNSSGKILRRTLKEQYLQANQ